VVAFLCGVAPLRAADRLGNLKASHPRLLFSEADFARTRVWCDIDSLTRKTWLSLKAKGEQFLTRPALTYALDPTPQQRLLAVSREALERISLLAALYRLDGDVRYRDGAVQVLRTVSAFPDWHPSHFLDASEMTFAVALGYDWLHKDLTPGLRDTLRVAIATKGLRPGMDAYRGKANSWWVKSTNNWNQVCNAGLAIGALAIAEDSTALSRSVVDSVLWSLPVSMDASYAPDGGFVEGVGYWEYGTNYTVYLLGSLQSALGSTFGLMESPGFDRTADYRLQMVGPTNLRYDYADQSVTNNFVSSMFWFAKAFDRPFYARTERINPGTPNIFALMWYDPELAAKPDAYALPLAERYDRLDVAVFRSSWSDAGAWYVGFKGGDNAASHAHLDQGSFVMEKDGVRWVSDLGSDNYGVPNYFVDTKSQAGAHWQMYRTRTEGHGTLTISDRVQVPLAFPSQSITAVAPLVDFHDGAIDAWAIADLTSSYQPIATDARAVTRAHRGIRLWPESQMLVQDEVVSSAPVEVVWNLLTEAAVSLEGSAMTMARKGKTMRAEILAPVGARFDTVTCHPPDSRIQAQKDAGLAAENPNQGYTKVIVRLPMGVVDATLAVRFFPGGTAPLAPSLLPLSRWKESASGVAEPSGRASLGRGKVAVELGTGRRIALDRPLPVGKQLVNRDGRLRLVLVK
jgi:hypothetical protein